MKLSVFVETVILLSALEALSIIYGVLPPVLSYSPGNLLFSFVKLAVIAYIGIISAHEGLKRSALFGAILGFSGAAALCVFSLFGTALSGRPMLGLPALGTLQLSAALASIVISNAILGALLAAISGAALKFFAK
jgi:hypothetical protein